MSADEDASGDDRVSDQAFVNGALDVWDGRVTLRGSHEASLEHIGGKDESVDYPARSILGVDYHLSGDTTLFAEYEHADGSQIESDMMRIGMRTRPWERTLVKSSINSQATEYRSAHVRELRSHAGLPACRNTGRSIWASTSPTRCAGRTSSR